MINNEYHIGLKMKISELIKSKVTGYKMLNIILVLLFILFFILMFFNYKYQKSQVELLEKNKKTLELSIKILELNIKKIELLEKN